MKYVNIIINTKLFQLVKQLLLVDGLFQKSVDYSNINASMSLTLNMNNIIIDI